MASTNLYYVNSISRCPVFIANEFNITENAKKCREAAGDKSAGSLRRSLGKERLWELESLISE
jgi:hypothetical protein